MHAQSFADHLLLIEPILFCNFIMIKAKSIRQVASSYKICAYFVHLFIIMACMEFGLLYARDYVSCISLSSDGSTGSAYLINYCLR